MIQEKELRTYLDDGYCLERNLIPGDAIAAVRARVHEQMEDQPDWRDPSWQLLDPERKKNSKGQPLPVGIQGPAKFDPVFDAVASHPNLVAAMTDVLGGEVELVYDQIGIKHGFITEEQGGRSYYHQDSYYWNIDPELAANCWIPLDEVGPEAIALGIKPGTHKTWTLQPHEDYYDVPGMGHIHEGEYQAFHRHRIPLADIDYSDEIIFSMQPGDGVYFTNYTWHRSEPNRSGKTLIFYAIAYRLTEEAIEARKSLRV